MISGLSFPGAYWDVGGFQGPLDSIFVAKALASLLAHAVEKFPMQDYLGQAMILHANNVANLPQLWGSKKGF